MTTGGARLIGWLVWAACAVCRAEASVFEITEIPGDGRTVAAELADLNGDGRTDLLQIVFRGIPPEESRWIRVYLQSERGLPTVPTRTWPLPSGAAAYDVADAAESPGEELLLMHAAGVTVLSLAGPKPEGHLLPVPDPPTLAASQDERGIDRLLLFRTDFGREPWLLVPLPGRVVALSTRGEVRAVLDVGARSNYLIPPRPGPLVFESELQVFFDAPRISAGDIDGDGRLDVVAAARHELRVFLRRPDGSYPQEPDRIVPIARISEQDHIRGSGAMRVDVRDVNADGRTDVLLSHASGAVTDARTLTSIHLNRGGAWNLEEPDQRFESEGSWTTDELIDLDGDGRLELIRVALPLSVLELIEVLVTRALDAEVTVYRAKDGGAFESEPWVTKKLGVPLSFDTFRPRGFLPTVHADLNGDGHLDLVGSGAGDRIEVFLGGPGRQFRRRDARQKADSRGRVRFGDLDRDGLPDMVVYDPRRPDAAVRIARNTGALPGTQPRLRDVATE